MHSGSSENRCARITRKYNADFYWKKQEKVESKKNKKMLKTARKAKEALEFMEEE